MATANQFQTRALMDHPSVVSANEVRVNALLKQAEMQLQTLNELQQSEQKNNQCRETKIELWSRRMLEKIDQVYAACLHELEQSFEQLKLFQQIMISILNRPNENCIDAKKLQAIEQEICILKCLTYQLDTSKVKIEGQLKMSKGSDNHRSGIAIDVDDHEDHHGQYQRHDDKHRKESLCRILIHRDAIESIEPLPAFEKSIQMSARPIDEHTPERVLTVTGPNTLDVIKDILASLSSPSISSCQLRILLHQSYVPLIVGKMGDRSKILREKHSLQTLTIHPTCAPHSTERVLLLRSLSSNNILSCLEEIFSNIHQHPYEGDDVILYDETNYDASLVHEYGGFVSTESILRLNEQQQQQQHHGHHERAEEGEMNIRRYSALDAWNGSVEADTEHEFSVVKIGEDSIIREFWINHGQFGALLGPHGVRIAQIRSQCRTVRIHTVAGSSIDTCSVKVIGPRADVNHAVNLIIQSIKEHDRKFPFKHHRFSGRLR